MAQSTYLASTVVTGVALAVLLVLFVRSARPIPAVTGAPSGGVSRAVRGPMGWTLGFFALLAAVTAGTLAYVSGAVAPAMAVTLLAVVATVAFVGYLLYGVYAAARGNGHHSALAAGEALVVLGVFALVAVVTVLLLG
ncbi:hypothetical protein [Natronomonas sp. EA1]|uniref:hypothetical protein n=1 Tax=Natronomonas sp. EA1 TaxID=3421655 RepID=UPI003EBF0D75